MADQPISFSGSDYTTELERLTTRARELLTEWTDQNYSDPLVVIMALQATTTDLCRMVVDNYAQENSVAWARFRQSLIDIAKMGDYLPTLMSAASTRLRLTRRPGAVGVITIPQWTAFSRSDGLEYLTIYETTIESDSDYADVGAMQGILVTRTLTAADFTITDWSGKPRYNLGSSIAAGTVLFSHDNGDTVWEEVDSFFEIEPTDYVFVCELNGDDDTVWLTLGNGNRGSGPVNSDMVVSFIRTAGPEGNGGVNTVTRVPESLSEYISCSNIEICTGGAGSETREQLRESIPDRFSIQRRGVTPPDYERIVKDVPGILHCKAFDINDTREWPHMTVGLYVVPHGGGPMTTYQKQLIWEALAEKGELGEWNNRYTLRDASENPVSFQLRVGLIPGGVEQIVRSAIASALEAYMAPTNQGIGQAVSFTVLHSLVARIANVSWVEFDSPSTDVVPASNEIPTFGGLVVSFV